MFGYHKLIVKGIDHISQTGCADLFCKQSKLFKPESERKWTRANLVRIATWGERRLS